MQIKTVAEVDKDKKFVISKEHQKYLQRGMGTTILFEQEGTPDEPLKVL